MICMSLMKGKKKDVIRKLGSGGWVEKVSKQGKTRLLRWMSSGK